MAAWDGGFQIAPGVIVGVGLLDEIGRVLDAAKPLDAREAHRVYKDTHHKEEAVKEHTQYDLRAVLPEHIS